MTDDLGDRMKAYESAEAQRRLTGQLPICIRLDGRGFSRFTRGFDKPFDPVISNAMRKTARALLEQTHARIAFVQSDEISLVLEAAGPLSSVIFDGRLQKMTSVFASMATLTFALEIARTHPDIVARRMPVFDARAWEVPSRAEAANVLLWRAQDARRNGISAAARRHFSFRELQHRSSAEMRAMLADRGIDYDVDHAPEDRLGVFYRRVARMVTLDPETLIGIPEAHRPASPIVERTVIEAMAPVYFGDVANRPDVVFEGAKPRMHQEEVA